MDGSIFISHSSADKPIADTICHRLEENGFRCWIAPRDIRTTDWAGSIMDGLKHSEVFVVIISRNSIPSAEVTKEVTEATRTCRYLLPFKVDDEMLPDRLRYHLGPCHWLDAVTPPLEKRIDELIDRLRHLSDEDAVYMNSERRKLIEKPVFPRGLFLGREREIAEVEAAFLQDNVVFLQGMGGIGKSEIAKGYAKAHRADYDTIIFASCTAGIFDLVCSDDIGIENLRRAQGEPEALWFRRKLEAFRSLADARTLLIVDNYDVEEDPHFPELIAASCRFLFTSRYDHSEYPTVKVGRIDDFDAVRRLFAAHYARPIAPAEQETVDEILRLVGCHTITVELIAKQMKASFLKPGKMLEKLKASGVNTQLKEKIKGDDSADRQTSFAFIRRLFSFSALSGPETHLLSVMALVPVSGIDVETLGETLALEDYDPVNMLIGKSWLHFDEETGILQLHPVIADVVRAELQPDPVQCADYVKGLWRILRGCWFFPVEKRNGRYRLLKHFLSLYPEPTLPLWQEYLEFVNVPWICGDFSTAQSLGERVYRFAVAHFGSGSSQAGCAAIYLGGAYHNGGDNDRAEDWYKTALEHRRVCLGHNDPDMPNTLVKVGRSACLSGRYDEAEKYYREAGEIYDELLKNPQGWIGNGENRGFPPYYLDYLVELERLEMGKGNYEKALEICEKSYGLYLQAFGENNPNAAYSLTDMGICRSMLGDHTSAQKALHDALDINLSVNGKASIQTLRTKEAIADDLMRSSDASGALSALTELTLDAEKYFGAESKLSARLRQKQEDWENNS